MSDLSLTIHLRDAVQGRIAVKEQLLPHIGAQLLAGRRLAVTVMEAEDALTIEQRGYYHVVLEFIADHAVANGQKFPMPVWKEHFRAKFLGSKRKKYRDPMTGRHVWRTIRISTEDLGVKGYGTLIEQVTAFASTDLGLTVPEPRTPLAKAARLARGKPKREVIDQDTGEITEVAA